MDKPLKIKANILKGNVALKGLAVLIVLVLAGAAAYGMYVWQQSRADKSQQQLTGLNRQITSLNQQIIDLKAQLQLAKQGQQPSTTYTTTKGVKINVYLPANDTKITSPLVVIGQVPGNWSFEASFPVRLQDSQGKVIAQIPAQLLGDWMTDQPVPFTAKLEYPATATGSGTLVLQKDNPSGLPQNDDSLAIPVKF